MTNINDMFQAADAASESGLLGPDALPTDTVVKCRIVFSQAKIRAANLEKDKGVAKTFNSKLEVIEPGHPHEGGQFFDAIHLSGGDHEGEMSDGQLGYNKRLFGKLQGAGLTGQFFAGNPSDEAIAKALVGKEVIVKLQWQERTDKQKETGQDPFLDNTTTWSPVDAAGGYVPGQAAAPQPTKGW